MAGKDFDGFVVVGLGPVGLQAPSYTVTYRTPLLF